jgi:hypothetical protein
MAGSMMSAPPPKARPHRPGQRMGLGAGTTVLSRADMAVVHPACHQRVLITQVRIRERQGGKPAYLLIEGVCFTCDRYVRLEVHQGQVWA